MREEDVSKQLVMAMKLRLIILPQKTIKIFVIWKAITIYHQKKK